jgi:hypothetical protein
MVMHACRCGAAASSFWQNYVTSIST